MEEEIAAAYYDELTRKGGGAARFKQGLGFSSAATTTTSDDQPSRGSALPSSSSFLSNFVKASSLTKENEVDKKTQLENIQSKLKKKGPASSIDVPSEKSRVRDSRDSRRRSRSREKESRRGRSRSRERRRRRSRSRERRGGGGSDEERGRLRRRHKSPSRERRRERKGSRKSRSRSCSDDERRYRRSRRSRSISPRDRRRSEKGREGGGKDGRVVKREGNGAVDYTVLIDGYDKMTPAERVKAKMKLQLTQTAEKDTKMGTGSQWERFDFNKDAPVDDEEIEAADDDAELVKHIGKSFRFTSFEAKSEDKIKNAHDEAMFGVPVSGPSYASESGEERGSGNENENENKETKDTDPASGLINEKVLSKQQGSWRDRARRNVR